MSTTKSGNLAYDTAVLAAEAARQVAIASATTQAAADAAAVTFYRAVIVSAKANQISFVNDTYALLDLGTGGV
jgi:hypothetical protein